VSTLDIYPPTLKATARQRKGGEKMKILHMVAYALLWVGGLNLGLSVLGFDVVKMVLGGLGLESVFNLLVGASAVYSVATHKGDCKACGK